MELTNITQTIEGYPVKNLKYNQRDNIIVAQVLCPLFGDKSLHEGFIVVQYTKQGNPLKQNKGRTDLKLKL